MRMGNRVARILWQRQVVRFSPTEPFTYASGLKGPLYCDNRRLLAYPLDRREVVGALASGVKQKGWRPEGVLALATGGIAYGAWLAEELNLPFGYIRSREKGHGSGKLIEGFDREGASVIVVEDLINQGSSLGRVLPSVMESSLLLGVLCIVDYQMAVARREFAALGVEVHSLVGFGDLLEEALVCGLLGQEQVADLWRWQRGGSWT